MKTITTTRLLPTKKEYEILKKALFLLDDLDTYNPIPEAEEAINKAFNGLDSLFGFIECTCDEGEENSFKGDIIEIFNADYDCEVKEDNEEDDKFFHSQYELNP